MSEPLPHPHPDAAAVRRLFAGDPDPATAEDLWRHLRQGCPTCRQRVLGHLLSAPARLPASYEAAFGRSFQGLQSHARRLERERREAVERAQRLAELPAERQDLLIANLPAFRTWGLAERLLELCQAHLWELDRTASRRAARTALRVARALEPSVYGVQPTRDLEARAWAAVGNQHRICEQVDLADAAFRRAEALFATGTGDPLHRCRLLSLRASLLDVLGRWEEAVETVDAGLSALPPEARRLRCQLLVKRAQCLEHDHPGDGLRDLSAALDALPEEDPLLRVIVRLARGRTFLGLGRPSLAERELLIVRGALRSLHNPVGEQLATWNEGSWLRFVGHPGAADRFRQVWELVTAQPTDSRLAILAVEWIDADLATGRLREAARTATLVGGEMERRGVPAHILRDWQQVRERVADGGFPRAHAAPLTRHFWRAWHDPDLRLDLPA